jgi:NAD(P)-dependent dehydrogenase (short-subunit alcohol dehydrogenase family)
MWDEVLTTRAAHHGVSPEDVDRQIVGYVPMGRSADPSEMVGVAVFLASDDSGYVTGQTYNVDGGLFSN